MNTEVKVLGGILIGSLLLMVGIVSVLSGGSKASPNSVTGQSVTINYSRGEKIGTDSAKVKLVEFGDFQCPACKAYEPSVEQIRTDFKQNFELIFRNFPLPQHQNAWAAANFAMYAASQKKYWEVHDKLYETQDQWANLADPSAFFANLGKGFGLDPNKVTEAVQKSLFNDLINQDIDEGTKLNVNATPTFFLNGQQLNLQNFSDLHDAVDQALKK